MDQPRELTADRVSPWIRNEVVVAVFVPLSLLGGLLPSFSLSANLYVLLLGAALLAAGLSRRLPRAPAPRELTGGVLWWLLPIGVFGLVEGFTFALSRSGAYNDYPTLSLLFDPLFDGYLLRSLGYFGWLTVFWGLVRR